DIDCWHSARICFVLTVQQRLLVFFLSRLRRPPGPPLFPYTTLFRSGTVALLVHPEQRDALVADPALVPHAIEEILRWDAPVRPIDRKSTRLNSSHVKISYAVFCLKKKKKQNHIMLTEDDMHYQQQPH